MNRVDPRSRRAILRGLGLAALFGPRNAGAQPAAGKRFMIGLLASTRPSGQPPAGPGSGETVVAALKELGYVEGRNIIIERRYSEGIRERLPGLATELVDLKPDVIFAFGAAHAAALHRATSAVPVVAVSDDPVAEGLVASLARPGGNVTGLQAQQRETAGKRLALLNEAIPGLSREGLPFVTSVWPANQWLNDTSREAQSVAQVLRLTVQVVYARDQAALDTAFAALAREHVEAVLIPSTTLAVTQRRRLADLARTHRIPAMCDDRAFVEAGLFMSYGPDYREFLPRAAPFIDKIPPSLLQRADQVIE